MAEPVAPEQRDRPVGSLGYPRWPGRGWRRKAGYLRQAIEAINATR